LKAEEGKELLKTAQHRAEKKELKSDNTRNAGNKKIRKLC